MRAATFAGLGFLLFGCQQKTKRFTTNVEIVQIQAFGADPKVAPSMMDFELKFSECPGDQRKIIRGDRAFSQCGHKFKKGDKATVEVVATYQAERGTYRSDITRIGDCAVKLDTSDAANYESIQTCTELKASGAVVGVHCDRTRNKELVAKCPWFGR